jgi:hypothetical protein
MNTMSNEPSEDGGVKQDTTALESGTVEQYTVAVPGYHPAGTRPG